ncbi:hypothetical protein KIPB_005345 [Kipferlia bialata]|uniref:Uncharacterized protein n=1 Tax=Kipferlia bialata TaxID=797122 RepID=A0A9K3GI25_9EUKA|nr:hypothetical protein KIPB_005345 [Kipferlia bialata]|eukprot:g5345.t1
MSTIYIFILGDRSIIQDLSRRGGEAEREREGIPQTEDETPVVMREITVPTFEALCKKMIEEEKEHETRFTIGGEYHHKDSKTTTCYHRCWYSDCQCTMSYVKNTAQSTDDLLDHEAGYSVPPKHDGTAPAALSTLESSSTLSQDTVSSMVYSQDSPDRKREREREAELPLSNVPIAPSDGGSAMPPGVLGGQSPVQHSVPPYVITFKHEHTNHENGSQQAKRVYRSEFLRLLVCRELRKTQTRSVVQLVKDLTKEYKLEGPNRFLNLTSKLLRHWRAKEKERLGDDYHRPPLSKEAGQVAASVRELVGSASNVANALRGTVTSTGDGVGPTSNVGSSAPPSRAPTPLTGSASASASPCDAPPTIHVPYPPSGLNSITGGVSGGMTLPPSSAVTDTAMSIGGVGAIQSSIPSDMPQMGPHIGMAMGTEGKGEREGEGDGVGRAQESKREADSIPENSVPWVIPSQNKSMQVNMTLEPALKRPAPPDILSHGGMSADSGLSVPPPVPTVPTVPPVPTVPTIPSVPTVPSVHGVASAHHCIVHPPSAPTLPHALAPSRPRPSRPSRSSMPMSVSVSVSTMPLAELGLDPTLPTPLPSSLPSMPTVSPLGHPVNPLRVSPPLAPPLPMHVGQEIASRGVSPVLQHMEMDAMGSMGTMGNMGDIGTIGSIGSIGSMGGMDMGTLGQMGLPTQISQPTLVPSRHQGSNRQT